jgi:hypothetical protein
MIKKSIVLILILFGLLQLLRPKKSDYTSLFKNDFLTNENNEGQIKNIVTNNCYSCHANNINSEWYYKITSINFLTQHDAKKNTIKPNFSNWRLKNTKQKIKLLDDILNVLDRQPSLTDNKIAYHKEVNLTKKETERLKNWLLILKFKYDLKDLPM